MASPSNNVSTLTWAFMADFIARNKITGFIKLTVTTLAVFLEMQILPPFEHMCILHMVLLS